MGADANLVGFNRKHSPRHETLISLSMYRADTFVKLQRALKITATNFETTFNQSLEKCSLQYSHWTKEALLELFSVDLDLSPILYGKPIVCPYCLYQREVMAQPYWMRILKLIRGRTKSQSIQNLVETMLSTKPLSAAVSRDDYEQEETYPHIQIQNQNSADPEMEDQHLSDLYDKPVSIQPDDEMVREFSICDGASVDDEDMCLFCWYEWEETGLRPSLDESKCLGCGQRLSSPKCMGKGIYSELFCRYCEAKQMQAIFAMKQKQKRRPPPTIDSDEEDNHYSPYLIHT